MRMPSFTAEASLGPATGSYRNTTIALTPTTSSMGPPPGYTKLICWGKPSSTSVGGIVCLSAMRSDAPRVAGDIVESGPAGDDELGVPLRDLQQGVKVVGGAVIGDTQG
jgi:hypothetical protein